MPAPVTGSVRGKKAARVTAFGLLAVGALSALACVDGSHTGPEHVDPSAFSWDAPIQATRTVFIRNINGSVTVHPATDGNVRVTTEVRWHRGDPKHDLKFNASSSDGNVTICAMLAGSSCDEQDVEIKGTGLADKLRGRGTDANVAFTVYVPTGVKVDAFTGNGSIGVAATAPVKARSMNGTLKVATSVGPVDAETLNGDVDIRMTTLGGDGPVRAHSVNGSVAAYLPAKFDGSVKMETVLGGLSSDFAATDMKSDSKDYSATVGKGGRTIDLGTVTGSAALHKLNADGTVTAPPE